MNSVIRFSFHLGEPGGGWIAIFGFRFSRRSFLVDFGFGSLRIDFEFDRLTTLDKDPPV